MTILFVEDDSTLATGLIFSLKLEGYQVIHCQTSQEAETAIKTKDFSLALLDIMLPDGDGFTLSQTIRTKDKRIPIIFLTAVEDESNTVKGLELGADDYITKPFRLREVLARIKVVLRRNNSTKSEQENNEYKHICGVKIYYQQAKIIKNQHEIFLTAMEYRLLLTLVFNQGQILTRNQLLADLWDDGGNYINDNTLSVYIRRLREKVEDNPNKPQLIKTIRGLGYQLVDSHV